MNARLAILLGVALGQSAGLVFAEDLERGRVLYETFCVSCHDRSLHARKEPLAKSYAQLKAQVQRWQDNIGLSWDKSEIEDVAAYLNHTVYLFR